jgi:hypothetical protein
VKIAVSKSDENRGSVGPYNPHLAFSQSTGELLVEGRDGNAKDFNVPLCIIWGYMHFGLRIFRAGLLARGNVFLWQNRITRTLIFISHRAEIPCSHHLHQNFLVKQFLIKYDVNSSTRHILRRYTFVFILFMKKRKI